MAQNFFNVHCDPPLQMDRCELVLNATNNTISEILAVTTTVVLIVGWLKACFEYFQG